MTTSTITQEQLQEEIIHLLKISNKKIVHLNQEVVNRDQKIQNLEEQLAWFKRQIFGKRSERIVSDLNADQLTFDGFENLATNGKEKKTPVPAHERKKPNRDGKDKITLPDDLPVRTTILDISEEEKVCQETGQTLVQIGSKSLTSWLMNLVLTISKKSSAQNMRIRKGKKTVL